MHPTTNRLSGHIALVSIAGRLRLALPLLALAASLAAPIAEARRQSARPHQYIPMLRFAIAPETSWQLGARVMRPGEKRDMPMDLGVSYRIYLGDLSGLALTPELGYTVSQAQGHAGYAALGVGYYYSQWLGVGWHPRLAFGAHSTTFRHGVRVDTFHGTLGLELAHQVTMGGKMGGRNDVQLLFSIDAIVLARILIGLGKSRSR